MCATRAVSGSPGTWGGMPWVGGVRVGGAFPSAREAVVTEVSFLMRAILRKSLVLEEKALKGQS